MPVDRALSHCVSNRVIQEFSGKMQQVLGYDGPRAELYIWSRSTTSDPHLVWKVEIRPNAYERWRYFVDAHNDDILDKYQFSPTDGPTVGTGVGLDG